MFLNNVSKSLKVGGKFIGSCLNGKKVFDLLGSDLFVVGNVKGNKVWRIDKKYDIDELSDTEDSLKEIKLMYILRLLTKLYLNIWSIWTI